MRIVKKPKVKRFYWVKLHYGNVLHMLFGPLVEGERVACGRGPVRKGDAWWVHPSANDAKCRNCLRVVENG